MRIFYKKEGYARFISHISFCKIFERSLRRLEIPIRFSQGFTPHLKITYGPPLPIPIVGTNEFAEIELKERIDLDFFIKEINRILPEGIIVKNCEWVKNKFSLSKVFGIYYIPLINNAEEIKPQIEKKGKILEERKDFIKVIFKMENLNHKKIFINGIYDGIIRELIIENE